MFFKEVLHHLNDAAHEILSRYEDIKSDFYTRVGARIFLRRWRQTRLLVAVVMLVLLRRRQTGYDGG